MNRWTSILFGSKITSSRWFDSHLNLASHSTALMLSSSSSSSWSTAYCVYHLVDIASTVNEQPTAIKCNPELNYCVKHQTAKSHILYFILTHSPASGLTIQDSRNHTTESPTS